MSHATQKPARTLRNDLRTVRHVLGNQVVTKSLALIWLAITLILGFAAVTAPIPGVTA